MIEGQLVRLRPFRRADLPALRAWFDDPAVMRHWGTPLTAVPEDAFVADLDDRFARFDERGYFAIVPREPAGAAPIGRIEYEGVDPLTRSAAVMILIGAAAWWGRGFGTDAMVTLLRYLFHQRNLHRVMLTVLSENRRAIRAYEKVGFTIEGRLRDHTYFDGRYHDEVVMGLPRPEFDARWPPPDPPSDIA